MVLSTSLSDGYAFAVYRFVVPVGIRKWLNEDAPLIQLER
jgi:hypothetical protein